MKRQAFALVVGAMTTVAGWRTVRHTPSSVPAASVADTIIALERAALDRWGRGDPQGYVETYAEDVTYFDPFTRRRVDGLDAIKGMLAPIVGKVRIDRYDMLEPRVQLSGDVAVLTFNLVSHTHGPDGAPREVRWNSTEVYRRTAGKWKIMHNHWSFTTPEIKMPTTP